MIFNRVTKSGMYLMSAGLGVGGLGIASAMVSMAFSAESLSKLSWALVGGMWLIMFSGLVIIAVGVVRGLTREGER